MKESASVPLRQPTDSTLPMFDFNAGLVQHARRGSREALNALLRVHRPRLLRRARRCCGGCSGAEDLCQEACVKIVTGLSHLRRAEAFASWAHEILANEIRRCRRNCQKGGTANGAIESDPVEGMSVETNREATAELHALLNLLRARTSGTDRERGRIAAFMLDYFAARHEFPTVRHIADAVRSSHGSAQRHREALVRSWRRVVLALDVLSILLGQICFLSNLL